MLGKTHKKTRFGLIALAAAVFAIMAFATSASAKGVSGSTTLKLDPGAAGALQSLGVSVAPVGPATAGPDGVSFPITGVSGSVWPPTLRIAHSGGLRLSAGATSVDLTDYTIVLGSKPRLIATVGGARVAILNLSLKNARISATSRYLRVGPVRASLTADAAGALNATFGVSAFTEGLVLGDATVAVRYR